MLIAILFDIYMYLIHAIVYSCKVVVFLLSNKIDKIFVTSLRLNHREGIALHIVCFLNLKISLPWVALQY